MVDYYHSLVVTLVYFRSDHCELSLLLLLMIHLTLWYIVIFFFQLSYHALKDIEFTPVIKKGSIIAPFLVLSLLGTVLTPYLLKLSMHEL